MKKFLFFLFLSTFSLCIYADNGDSGGDSDSEEGIYKEKSDNSNRGRSLSPDYLLCSHGQGYLKAKLPDYMEEAYVVVKSGQQIIAEGYITPTQNILIMPQISGELFVRIRTSDNQYYSGYLIF